MADPQCGAGEMSMEAGKAESWSTVAIFLGGIVVSGLGFFLLEGRKHVTMDDVDRNSPYIKDKGAIYAQFSEINRRLERIEIQLDRLLDEKKDSTPR